jgi:membrane protein required for colicin V production
LNFAALLNVFDIVFILILFLLVIRGVVKGLVSELTSIGLLVLTIVLSIFVRKPLANLIGKLFKIGNIGSINPTEIIAVLLIFIVLYIVFKLLDSKMHDLLDRIELNNLDKALGFFAGLVEGVLAVFLIVYFVTHIYFFNLSEQLEQSQIAGVVKKIVPDTEYYDEYFKNKGILQERSNSEVSQETEETE